MNSRWLASFLALVALAACQPTSVPIDALATEWAASLVTPTPDATATSPPRPTPTPPTSLIVDDPLNDCVTGAFLPIDCSVLQRDVTNVTLVSDSRILTVTVTIEGQPWEQFPAHFAIFKFDTDRDNTTGSRELGIEHGLGTDTNIFWGWTPSSVPFGIEHYNATGAVTDTTGERDQIVTILDEQTLQLEVALAEIGSDTFNFVVSLEPPPGGGTFDFVPEPGESLSFPPQ